MVIENFSEAAIENLTVQISNLTTFIQAVGGIILLYLIFNSVNAFLNRKKQKELKEINKNLQEIKEILRDSNKKNKKEKIN